jgi:adenosylcobinamide-phosphate synthase
LFIWLCRNQKAGFVKEALLGHTAIVLAAVLLDLLLGDPRWLPHPVVFIGKLITALEKPLRRALRDELTGGLLLLALTVGITAGTAWLTLKAAYLLHPAAGAALSALLAWTCLAARSLHRESNRVAEALRAGDPEGARRSLSYIVGRDTADLDEPEIWRATVETVAENSSDGVIAPLFYLMLGGPALALAYKAVNTLDSMVGYKNATYLRFGRASARCDDLSNWLPARLTGLLMVAAAPLAGLSPKGAWCIMARDGRNHASPNSGIPEAAAAGALGVQLGGTNYYFGKPVVKPTIGDPLQPFSRAAYRGAVRLMYGAEALLVVAFLVTKSIE